jgi:hypothetical protein
VRRPERCLCQPALATAREALLAVAAPLPRASSWLSDYGEPLVRFSTSQSCSPRNESRSLVMTLEPMLRLIAGLFVAASVVLGMYVHPYFLWFTLFVGLNLVQSAFTNWCPMMTFLRRAGVREGNPVIS